MLAKLSDENRAICPRTVYRVARTEKTSNVDECVATIRTERRADSASRSRKTARRVPRESVFDSVIST